MRGRTANETPKRSPKPKAPTTPPTLIGVVSREDKRTARNGKERRVEQLLESSDEIRSQHKLLVNARSRMISSSHEIYSPFCGRA